MQKVIGIERLFENVGVGVEEMIGKRAPSHWYLRYFLGKAQIEVIVEITVKNFLERFLGLPSEAQESVLWGIISLIQSPGDSLRIFNDSKESGNNNDDGRIIHLSNKGEDDKAIHLLITR